MRSLVKQPDAALVSYLHLETRISVVVELGCGQLRAAEKAVTLGMAAVMLLQEC